jgi:hypothetical protein
MNASDVIDAYVADVANRLPRKQRNDVAYELKALLHEELAGKAEGAGRAPDEAMALSLVREFGQPDEVADRYRPPGFTIIRPADSRAFITMALGGVALQWAISLPAAFGPSDALAGLDNLSRLGRWWTSWGLGAFWWPGILVTITIVAGWLRHRWPVTGEWRPKMSEQDPVNRPLMVLAIASALVGMVFMVFLPDILSQFLPGKAGVMAHRIFAYDEAFVRYRGPWLLVLWILQLVLLAIVTAEGRWRQFTRRVEMAVNAAICALLVWFMTTGPIWREAGTDRIAKGVMVIVIGFILLDIGIKARREMRRLHPPALPAAHA